MNPHSWTDLVDAPDHGALRHVPEPVRFVVAAAHLAPSRGNTQPWRFSWDGARLWLRAVPERVRTAADPDGDEALLALGAALENLVVAAAARGLEARITPFPEAAPDTPGAPVVARAHLVERPSAWADAELWPAVCARRTHRGLGARRPLSGGDVLVLLDAARTRDTRLELCLAGGSIEELGHALGRTEALRLDQPALRLEALTSLRIGDDAAAEGVDTSGLELPPPCLRALREEAPVDALLTAHVRQRVRHSSALGLLSVPSHTPARILGAGRAMQRIWLAATERGLAIQPLTSPTALLRLAEARPALFEPSAHDELARLGEVVERAFPASAARRRLFLFRLFHADPPPYRAPRLPLHEVLELGGPAHMPGLAEA